MFTRKFLLDAGERAIKTFVQGTITGMLILLTVDGASWPDMPGAIAVGTFAGTLSALTSILSSFRGDPESASALENSTARVNRQP